MKPEMIMLVGIPGSGKSYWAEKFVKNNENYVIHSSDKLREELFGDENYQGKNGEVFQELHKCIKEDLKFGKNVIYDATNVNSRRRRAWIKELDGITCDKVCIVFTVPFERCLRNNWMRQRKLSDEVLVKFYKQWQTPYYFEGWDDIQTMYELSDERNMPDLYGYDQNNPHHSLSLGEHCYQVWGKVMKGTRDQSVRDAALFHDVGKPFCRFEDENGVSHYYGHENVGAYDALSIYGLSLKSSALIGYHMTPLSWENSDNTEELQNKYKKLWGETFYNDLMLIHEADVTLA